MVLSVPYQRPEAEQSLFRRETHKHKEGAATDGTDGTDGRRGGVQYPISKKEYPMSKFMTDLIHPRDKPVGVWEGEGSNIQG
jgi:hypothetical protein